MEVFNVLDRSLNVHKSYLLEASAGTGKTFSIENIVLRMLIETNPKTGHVLELQEILVVTFTRAATIDLKKRIRTSIDRARQFFCGLLNGVQEICSIDYLNSYIGTDQEILNRCAHRLEKALFSFDRAQIFTIHGFCSRMLKENVLEGGLSIDIDLEMSENPNSSYIKSIRDFFRTESLEGVLSLSQLKKIRKMISNGPQLNVPFSEILEKKILETIQKGLPIVRPPSFKDLFDQFSKKMAYLKSTHHLTSESITHDINLLSKNYIELKNKLNDLPRFASLFDLNHWEEDHFNDLIENGIFPLVVLTKKAKKETPIPAELLNCPDILKILEKELKPIVDHASTPEMVFALLAFECQKHVLKHLKEEEIFSFNDLLQLMKSALANEDLKQNLKSQFKVAIIDEFQDTDSIQWEIFQKLFLSDDSILYLVGDPKQSIYAFRQADIYTYLEARKQLGEEHHASLNTNYRSTPDLIEGLNLLFDSNRIPGLISLPAIDENLPYHPVLPSEKHVSKYFYDGLKSTIFCLITLKKGEKYSLEKIEVDYLFPYIAEKIQEHRQHDSVPFKSIAILISDRFQGDRLAKYLKERQIPSLTQKMTKISDSQVVESIREMLKAVIHIRNNSAIKVALGGKIIGWTHNQLENFEQIHIAESILFQFQTLRIKLYQQGISLFYQSLLKSSWHDDGRNVAEKILSKLNGLQFYTDLEHVIELLRDYEDEVNASPERLLYYLEEIKNERIDCIEKLKRRVDPTQDAVYILTGHSSKGLEFDIVFPLALLKRPSAPELFFPYHDHQNGHVLLSVSNRYDPRYLKYCDEIDAEKMRQLYVCMTRAKYRLYLPVIQQIHSKELVRGTASPMDLYLARFNKPLASSEILYQRIQEYNHDLLLSFLENTSYPISAVHLEGNQKEISFPCQNQEVTLVPPESLKIQTDLKFMYSFSGILSKKKVDRSNDKIVDPPKDFTNKNKTIHSLPSCSDTGNVLHKLFQELSFQVIMDMVSESELIPFILRYTEKTLFQDWEQTLASLIWKVLKTPIIGNTALCEIHHHYKEMEFMFPYHEDYGVEELKFTNGYLKGVIDLIFYFNDMYYLLDWKSNWLGPTNETYTKEKVITSMHEHDYFLQATIYKEALKRYLKIVDPRPFESIYGGTFYIYLRGIEQEGVLHFE